MEHALQPADAAYDLEKYDRIWQRVAPNLAPYPGPVPEAAPAAQPLPVHPLPPRSTMLSVPEEQLPGAIQDPCCMGSGAAEMLAVLEGFIEAELADRACFLALSRRAPAWTRQQIRDLAAESGNRAKRLLAAYYLITGRCFQPSIPTGSIAVGRWCPALRERYHTEACSGLNYLRAAEGTTDPCLRRLLTELSQSAYRGADLLLSMLEKAL